MPQKTLDYHVTEPKPFLLAALVDVAIWLAVVVTINVALLMLTWHANDTDRGAYWIAFGPANAAVAVIAMVCTPLFTRFSRRMPAKVHVTISLLVPVAAIVVWAVLFMRASA